MTTTLEFTENLVLTPVHARSSSEVIEQLGQSLRQAGCVTGSFEADVLAREAEHPTGLPTQPVGVAIPHAKPRGVLRSAIAVGILADPVEFRVMGAPDEAVAVRIVFLMALKESDRHLNILSALTSMLQDPDQIDQLLHGSRSDVHAQIESLLA